MRVKQSNGYIHSEFLWSSKNLQPAAPRPRIGRTCCPTTTRTQLCGVSGRQRRRLRSDGLLRYPTMPAGAWAPQQFAHLGYAVSHIILPGQ